MRHTSCQSAGNMNTGGVPARPAMHVPRGSHHADPACCGLDRLKSCSTHFESPISTGLAPRRARRFGGFRVLLQAEVFEVRRPWTLAVNRLLPIAAERPWSLPAYRGRRLWAFGCRLLWTSVLARRGLRFSLGICDRICPELWGLVGSACRRRFLRSDALRLWWQTVGSLGSERLRSSRPSGVPA